MPTKPPPKTLPAVRPNCGIEAAYRRKLLDLLEDMHNSLLYWLRAAYRDYAGEMAMDARIPVNALIRAMRKLGDRWLDRFDKAAPALAEYFAKANFDRSDRALAKILRDGGISVRFKPTLPVRNAMQAAVSENVGLIKSIAQEHLTRVEGAVMRSAVVGRDLASLTKELSQGYGISRRRASFIARDQTNKMTAVIVKTRQEGLGITKAVWLHSGGGREPRPEHVGWSGKTYDIAKGMYSEVDQAWVWPGTAINCRCVSKSVIPGLDD